MICFLLYFFYKGGSLQSVVHIQACVKFYIWADVVGRTYLVQSEQCGLVHRESAAAKK